MMTLLTHTSFLKMYNILVINIVIAHLRSMFFCSWLGFSLNKWFWLMENIVFEFDCWIVMWILDVTFVLGNVVHFLHYCKCILLQNVFIFLGFAFVTVLLLKGIFVYERIRFCSYLEISLLVKVFLNDVLLSNFI